MDIWTKVEIQRDRPAHMSRIRYLRVDGILMGRKYGRWSFAIKDDRLMRSAVADTAEEAMDWIDQHIPLALTRVERIIYGI